MRRMNKLWNLYTRIKFYKTNELELLTEIRKGKKAQIYIYMAKSTTECKKKKKFHEAYSSIPFLESLKEYLKPIYEHIKV